MSTTGETLDEAPAAPPLDLPRAVPTTVPERFGALIRESRRALDPPMTQKDLAVVARVHQPSVSAWELGKTLPAPETMLLLARLFKLDLSNLSPLPRRRPRRKARVRRAEVEALARAESEQEALAG